MEGGRTPERPARRDLRAALDMPWGGGVTGHALPQVLRHAACRKLTFFCLVSLRQFHESYSGFSSLGVRHAQERGLPVNMMDTFLSSSATTRQIVPDSMRKTNMMIKANPTLRGFVTDKVTNTPYSPASHDRLPTRTSSCKLVRDHDHELLVNIQTPSVYRFSPDAPLFRPQGSMPPATHAPGRPFTTHEPGRHRFFVSDVRVKLP